MKRTKFDCESATMAAELIRNRISNQQPFGRAKEAVAFGLGALLDGMVAASVGATIVWAQASAPLRALPGRWFEWTLSDAGGCLDAPILALAPETAVAGADQGAQDGVRCRHRSVWACRI